MAEDILQRIREADNLPSLPTVAMEVLTLTRKDDVSVEELAGVIQNDPALTARLLKYVNSSLFGVPRKIGSVKQAVGLLGLRTVKVMALSFSLAGALGGGESTGFDFQSYWRRSLTAGIAGRFLAKAVSSRLAEEAFVAGLLSDIGMVAAWRCVRQMYQPVLETWAKDCRPLPEIEQEYLGLTNANLSGYVLRNWGLPELLCDAVESHHGQGLERLSGSSLELAKIVHSAGTIAAVFLQDVPLSELDAVKEQCYAETGVDQAKLEEILTALDEHVQETASLLSVDVGTTTDYGQLQADAAMQLSQLSLQAEVERVDTARRADQARQEAERLHEEKKAILEVASTDGLTKLANRAAFDKRLEEELQRARDKGHPVALILMDVDHFKQFNDTYGHQAGDEVLRSVGVCLRADVRNLDFAARYGGEEFAVILAGVAAATVEATAQEIRQAIEERAIQYDNRRLSVTMSLGVACLNPPSSALTCEGLIKQADEQLYKAKRNGRNRVEIASSVCVGV